MEPLGALASVLSILKLVGTITCYLNNIKDAPEERTRLLVEISTVAGLLTTLRDLAVESEQKGTALAAVKALDIPRGPLAQFRVALEQIAVALAPGRGVKRFGKVLAWPFKKEEVRELLEMIERQKSLFILALQNDNVCLSRAIQSSMTGLEECLKALMIEQAVDHRSRAMEWLRPPRLSGVHETAKAAREPTTGNWFIHGEEFKSWRQQEASLLWLHGSPGCGKTVLCSTIIEHMAQFTRIHPECALCYYYFDWNDSENQLVSTMLRSIIVQLAGKGYAIPDAIWKLYLRERGNTKDPSILTLLKTLASVVEEVKRHVYVVIDALDESSERDTALDTLTSILDMNADKVQILVASRRERDIEFGLQPLPGSIVSMQRKVVDEDIAIHIHNRLLQDRHLKRWPDPVKEDIKSTLVRLSQGMFRWIVCQLDALKRCLKISVLKKTLARLPKTLGESYDRIILSMPDEYTKEAYFALLWLAFSERPVDIKEVAEAAVLDPAVGTLDPDDKLKEPQDILQICSSLVAIPDEGQAVDELRLSHFTVKEHLTGEEIRHGPAASFAMCEADAHAHIAHVCLFILHQFGRHDSLNEKSFDEFPLLKYAAQFWPTHVRKMGPVHMGNKNLEFLMSSMFDLTQGEHYFSWLRVYNHDYMGQPGKLKDRAEDLPPPLYLAAHLNLTYSARKLLDDGIDVNLQGGENGTALAAASFRGHVEMVELLLDANADVNIQAGHFKAALQAASYSGHERVGALLIDRSADPNVEGRFGSPLQAAARFGNTNLIATLLKGGASINNQGSKFHSALQEAARWGQYETVSFLLNQGAELDARAKDGSTALQLAASNDHVPVVQLLLSRGAAVNTPAGDFGTALLEACRWGNKKSIRVLLDYKADPNLQIGNYGSALQTASRWGYYDIVELLLDRGADINARSPRLGTALEAAKQWNRTQTLRLLLNRGAIDALFEKPPEAATDWADKNIFPALYLGRHVANGKV